MERRIKNRLVDWKNKETHVPLILRGARQVGKSFLIKSFGEKYFQNCVEVNFEQRPEFSRCFNTLVPREIVANLELVMGQSIIEGQTLLFIDEIQECKNALLALRYFKEQMPALHVIAAGSLLEDIDLFDYYEEDNIGEDIKSLAFHLLFQSETRTLKDEEISRAMERITEAIKAKGWEMRT